MSKTMRALLCMMMSVVLVLSMNVWTSAGTTAEVTSAQPRLSYTNYVSTSLSITTAGSARSIAEVAGYDGITTKIKITMKLQQYIALQWTTIAEWTGTFNDSWGALSKTKTVYTGRYRVKVNATVYSGSAYEKTEVISQEKYYTSP